MVDLGADVDVLRQRVDALELSAKEPKKPWYRSPSVSLSALALVLSFLTTVYTQVEGKQETIRSKKEELRKIIIGLIELRETFVKANPSPVSPQSQLLGAKQQVYLEAANRLIVQVPKEVSSSEYTIIANEHMSMGDFQRGEAYFLQAAGAAPTPALKSQALRILAISLFQPGPMRSFDKGRRHFNEAIDVLKGDTDLTKTHLTALTYEVWAAMETRNGFADDARHKLERARKYYSDLPANYPFRGELIEGLDARVAQGMAAPAPATR
jgi:tetratricopeptide (TPR) repeat protein